MKRIINDQLLAYLLRFLKNRSTASNLLECTDDWIVVLNSRQSVDVIYVDFSRAFDSKFAKLIAKLKFYWIEGKLLNWIIAFLHNRTTEYT